MPRLARLYTCIICSRTGSTTHPETKVCRKCQPEYQRRRAAGTLDPIAVAIAHNDLAMPIPASLSRPGSLRKHLIIPDCQVKPGVDTRHLDWIGRYIAEKRPEVVVCIGDFADMPSLSSYDAGKKCFEGRRYKDDILAAVNGMERLMAPIRAVKGYNPRLVMVLGNHDGDRISRAIENDPKLDGTISVSDLMYGEFGWEVHPFLKPVEIDGISYAHYFTSGSMGRPVTSAAALLREVQGSAVMGHVQFTDVAFHKKTQKCAIFAGICYLHDEDYLGFQGNNTRRQIVMLHEVNDGLFDPMFVSLGYLERRFSTGGASLKTDF